MRSIYCMLFILLSPVAAAQESHDPVVIDILPMNERAELRDSWLKDRLDTIVPMLMERENIDMWVLIAREYNEDPVVKTMLPATWLNARRRTILLFSRSSDGKRVERYSVSRYAVGDFFKAMWNPESEPDQWKRLSALIEARDPRYIAINISDGFALADGLTQSQYRGLRTALPAKYQDRLVSGERLAIGWLETRIKAEVMQYPALVQTAHAIIAEAFSNKVITPGKTTGDDVVWWLRDKVTSLGLDTWFHPSISVQREQFSAQKMTELFGENDNIIRPGDLLHVDFGITYLGLNTDTQHHAYVLKKGETKASVGLRDGLKAANDLQDILTGEFKLNTSGNQLLARARKIAIQAGLNPTIYSHPLGLHGHGAGATIGMWDNQDGTPVRGDYPVMANTAWSIELNIEARISEWNNQPVRFMLEEDAFFDGETVRYFDGRQNKFHLIKSD